MSTVTIDARFNGPPSSGHGGYSAGLLGTALDGPAEVMLLAPPPLDTPLTVEPADGGLALRDGETTIATAAPTTVDVGPPPQVEAAAVRAAMPTPEALREHHPFPTCFGCGPDRERSDALCLFAGELDPAHHVWGVTWTPSEEETTPHMVWAALDCPSSAPAQDPTGEKPIVLGRFAVDVREVPRAGVEHLILSAPLHHEGRKRENAVWLVDPAGAALAAGRALWIELRPEHAAQRRGDGR